MKILHVTKTFKPFWEFGGVARVSYEMTRHLLDRGHEITVYTIDGFSSIKKVESNKLIDMGGLKTYYFYNLFRYFPGHFELISPGSILNIIEKNINNYDLIHFHDLRTSLTVVVAYYARKKNIPYIIQAHGSVLPFLQKQRLKNLFDLFFGYKILKAASKVIAVSNAEVDQYVKMGVPKEKIVIIPNGIDVDSFNDLPEKGTFRKQYGISEKYIVLFLGRLHERKGIDFLIKSYAELKRELDDVVLVLAGPDDGYRAKAEMLINNLNLTNQIKFTGYIDEIDKLAAYVDADVLVYPAILEIFGLVPFEAIMCGTPVIVTDDCGCGDLIKDAKCGYLVKYGDVNDLEKKMKHVIENPSDGKKLVEAGREYIEENIAWNNVVKQMEEVYENCIHHV